MNMKPIQSENLKINSESTTCSTEGKDCGCSNGMCPGLIAAGIMVGGWGLWALGTWVWGLIGG